MQHLSGRIEIAIKSIQERYCKFMKEFTHLTCAKRVKIFRGLCDQKTQGQIAKELERSRSTIMLEIRKHKDDSGYFYPDKAHKLAQVRRLQKYELKIDKDPELKAFIIEKLHDRLSPKMIAGLWKKKNPSKKISAQTIYTWIECPEGTALKLGKLLVRQQRKRGTKSKPGASTIKHRVSIHDRPDYINERVEF